MVNVRTDVVELNPFEIAAYWWVRRIKNIADEFNQDLDLVNLRKIEFGRIFDFNKLKTAGYRKIYLALVQEFEKACENKKRYSLRTHMGGNGHLELNKWLSEVVKADVPNINLCENNAPDTLMIISLNNGENCVYVGETDLNGIRTKLPKKYKANALLCGSKKITQNDDEPKTNE